MKSIMLILVLAFCSQIAIGQAARQAHPDRQEAMKQMDDFFKEIGVTEAQMVQITAERKAMDEAVGKARKSGNREDMKAVRDSYNVKMEKILTEEQYAAYIEKQKEMRANKPRQKKAVKPN